MGEAFVFLRGPDTEKCQGGFDGWIVWLENYPASFKAHLLLPRPLPGLLVGSSPSQTHPVAPRCLQGKVKGSQPSFKGPLRYVFTVPMRFFHTPTLVSCQLNCLIHARTCDTPSNLQILAQAVSLA